VAAPRASRQVTAVGGRELPRADEGLVVAGEPIAVQEHLAQVDPGVQDRPDRGVLHPGPLFDLPEAEALGTQGEDPSHRGRLIVGDQVTLDEVVAHLRAVRPMALPGRLLHTQADVLGELLPVELRERSEDVVEHAPGRRGQVDLLGERVQAHPVLPERVREQDQVAEVPGQAIQAPHEHVRDAALLHHRQELLQAGSLEVLAGAPGVLDEHDRSETVELGVRAELLGLTVDGEAFGGLLLRRDPAVGRVQHPSVTSALLAPRVAARRRSTPRPLGRGRDPASGTTNQRGSTHAIRPAPRFSCPAIG
jgi:hypothetical protein